MMIDYAYFNFIFRHHWRVFSGTIRIRIYSPLGGKGQIISTKKKEKYNYNNFRAPRMIRN